jgi:hypothetical protein
MEFFKKHYEKIILSAVLAGLAAVVVIMLIRIESVKTFLDEKRTAITQKEAAYRPISTVVFDEALARAKKPTTVILSGPHNTLNPVLWQIKPDGTRLKVVTGTEVGPGAAAVTSITPLHLIVALESISGGSYNLAITREAATNVMMRKTFKRYVSTNSPKTDFLMLKEVKGPAENPTEIICELTENKEDISLAKDKPFKRVDAYMADIKYDVEGRTFTKLRNGDLIGFGGDEYVVEIHADEVILSAKSSTKRTVLKYTKAQ